jgi:hypothetical protein
MNEMISKKISEIRQRFFEIESKLKAEIQEKDILLLEIKSLTSTVMNLSKKNDSKSENIKFLNKQLEEAVLTSSKDFEKRNRDLEIDLIVKEIDQCIHQIKTSL